MLQGRVRGASGALRGGRVQIENLEDRRLMAAVATAAASPWHAPLLAEADVYGGATTFALAQPSITSTSPAAGATGVRRDAFVAAYVRLPNVGHGVKASTLTSANVKLYRTADTTRTAIGANLNTTGGGDAITLTPTSLLASNTKYTFVVTSGVTDTAGAPFQAFSMSFTTGTAGGPTSSTIAFDKVGLPTAAGRRFSGVTMGPDGRLYAATLEGEIVRFNVNADGTLSSGTVINTVRNNNGGRRIITGIRFEPGSTAANLILWVNHSQGVDTNATDWTGKLSRLSGANLERYNDFVVGLPRSVRDHLNNQIDFNPADGMLYMSMGSNTAMGAPDNAWGMRPERLLSAAILRVNIQAIGERIANGQGPLNVKTQDGGTYNPYASGAPVTLYATGVRNAYDLLWHSNGNLYAPTNGSAPGGNTPAGGGAVGLNNVSQVEPDWLFKIQPGKYYGHPNPKRAEYVLNGGNPTSGTDKFQVNAYPVGTKPDPDWDPAIYNFGANRSPNGVVEYKSGAFGGALAGSLLVVRYSGGDDILVLTPDAGGNIPSTGVKSGITGLTGFVDPLDIAENVGPGHLYVIEHGAKKITLLRPRGGTSTGTGSSAPVRDPRTLYFNDPVGGVASAARSMTIKNTRSSSVTITGLTVVGTNASMFKIVTKPTLPKTLAAGATTSASVNFNPPSGTTLGLKVATLRATLSDGSTLDYSLRALATAGVGGANEPSLKRILDMYQVPINVGDANPATSDMPLPLAAGHEAVNLQKLVKAGAGPVTVEPLAVFASAGTPTIRFGRYNPSTGAKSELLSITQAQTVNPPLTSGTTSFDPGSATFGLYASAPAFGTRTAFSEDFRNTFEPVVANRRKVLFFPLKDKAGASVPNAYVVAFEEVAGSYDYQDFLAVVRNVKAPGTTTTPTGTSGVTSLTLINADNDQPIMKLTSGATLDLRTLPTRNLSIRAETAGTIGSVRFDFDGSIVRYENYSGYTIAGEDAGDIRPFSKMTAGAHTVAATAYTNQNGGGSVVGAKLSVSFTIVG